MPMGFTESDAFITLHDDNANITITKEGFRYSIADAAGAVLAPAHAQSGLVLGGADAVGTELLSATAESLRLAVTTSSDDVVEVDVSLTGGVIEMTVDEVPGSKTIDFRTGAVGPAYGLGDYGSHANGMIDEGTPCGGNVDARHTSELSGAIFDNMTNQGSCKRFISNFVVFPQQGLAQVLFEEGSKRVALTEDENRLGANNATEVDSLYYFVGDMPKVYADYKAAREAEGYPEVTPRQMLFELGWESYGALAWNTLQAPVEATVRGYAEHGYDLAWGVVGSGFWPGPRGNGIEGTTTSFGMWDDACDYNPADGSYPDMDCPRYPEPDRLKATFKELGMDLLLGIRNNFKAPDKSEYYNEHYDGEFAQYALENDYFLRDADGELVTVEKTGYPKGPNYILDAPNAAALEWYVEQSRLWGVDGFKEDAMLYEPVFAQDGIWNPLLKALHEAGDSVIVRNALYSVPGDVVRNNDTYYGTGANYNEDPDRLPVNMLNFAASAAPNVYADYVGGTPSAGGMTDPAYQDYFVRNAWLLAVSPTMAMGRGPWEMDDPQVDGDQGEQYAESVFKATQFHQRLVPYLYDAALDSNRTGYPSTMTPLPIAFPDDPNTYHLASKEARQYSWLLGENILATPVFGSDFESAHTRDVYLPEGEWIDYETGGRFSGRRTLQSYPLGTDRVPAFVGGSGILVEREDGALKARIFPVGERQDEYKMDGAGEGLSIKLMNTGWDPELLRVVDRSGGGRVDFEIDPITGAVEFDVEPGHSYQLNAGGQSDDTIERPSGSNAPVSGLDYTVNDDGRYTLTWQPVEGALGYTAAVTGACGVAGTAEVGSTAGATELNIGHQPGAGGTYTVTAWTSGGATQPSAPLTIERIIAPTTEPVIVTNESTTGTCDPATPPYLEEPASAWRQSSVKAWDGSATRYSGTAGASATWSADLSPGTYQVAVWYPASPGTPAARYDVLGASEAASVTLDQRSGGGQWIVLGEWDFDGSSEAQVRVTREGSGNLRADSARFTPVDS
ncbi:TIM-barrel domain-containing protein [Tessaracoccus oleiagri]|uniref:Glycosyl hydrolases family 31 n=1 Tax=Tessaracoccus oleiagri TaxID=686624 RepID=A0A1G9HKI6_9ACTN|nr:TIM-barrel domain-containing protein [Tessaracoccus oleiagri]SDL13511.1 Glycosyl hydrolases family 31 [Tessaracoccus oleiagri]